MALFDFFKGKKEESQVASEEASKKSTKSAKKSGTTTAISQDTLKQNSNSGSIQNIDIPVQIEAKGVSKSFAPKTIILSSEDESKKIESKAKPKWKPIKHIKLSIFLIENTKEMKMERTKISQIFKKFLDSSFIIINYGSIVRVSSIMESSDFEIEKLFVNEDLGDNSCLYNALTELENVVEENYHKFKQEEDNETYVDSIEIIGIGTGTDNFSTVSEKLGTESFAKIANLDKVTIRYFCLGEQNIVNPAVIGFRSIGIIPKSKA